MLMLTTLALSTPIFANTPDDSRIAKTFQYSALVVLGAEGVMRVKKWWKNRKR